MGCSSSTDPAIVVSVSSATTDRSPNEGTSSFASSSSSSEPSTLSSTEIEGLAVEQKPKKLEFAIKGNVFDVSSIENLRGNNTTVIVRFATIKKTATFLHIDTKKIAYEINPEFVFQLGVANLCSQRILLFDDNFVLAYCLHQDGCYQYPDRQKLKPILGQFPDDFVSLLVSTHDHTSVKLDRQKFEEQLSLKQNELIRRLPAPIPTSQPVISLPLISPPTTPSS